MKGPILSKAMCVICAEINPTLSNVENAEILGVSEATIRRHKAQDHNGLEITSPGTIDVSGDGAQINNVVVTSPLNDDWSTVFELFNLDPTQFEVVDDTVKMSTWQQSKGTEDGGRDTVQLYSYSARFRRVSQQYIRESIIEEWRDLLLRTPSLQKRSPRQMSGRGTYTVMVADPQLGKSRTEEAVDNWKRGILGHIKEIKRLEDAGTPVQAIHLAFMGDEHEGVVNNYRNQPHIVELNFTQQIELDYDLRVWSVKQLLALGYDFSASSVISNHGEWTRNGSKDPETSKGDNSSTFVARMVKRLFDETGHGDIEWHIANEEPGLLIDLSGVETYFSHGYVEKGRGGTVEARMKNAIERQILGRTEALGATKLWIMAHYHHFYSQEFEGRTLFGCPALEAERSSEYMLDQYGVWSRPGMLGIVISDRTEKGWDFLTIQ